MNIKNKQIKQRLLICTSLIISVMLVLLPHQAYANVFGNAVSGLLATVSEGLMRAIAWILNETVAKLFTDLMQFQNFFTTGVNAGWEVTRDFANLLFALVLLFIAIATVLSVGPLDSYSYKRMLPPFIFAAISINFSKAIVGVLIDISQIIMIEFYNAIAGAGGVFNSISAISMYNSTLSGNSGTDPAPFILAIIVMLILMCVLLWTSLILVIRIVTLWLVIMTAPLAFVSFAVPPMKGIWKQWLENLQSSLTVGPVLMFYLYLSLRVFEAATLGTGFNPLNYTLVIVLIIMSNIYAQQSSAAAPGFAKKAVTFGVGAAVGAATFGMFHRKELAQMKDATFGTVDKGIRGSAKTVDIAGSIFGKDPLLAEKYELAKENVVKTNAKGKGMFGQFGQEVFGGKEAEEELMKKAKNWRAHNREIAQDEPLSTEDQRILGTGVQEYSEEIKDQTFDQLTSQFKTGNNLERAAVLQELASQGDLEEFFEKADIAVVKGVAERFATTGERVLALAQIKEQDGGLNMDSKTFTSLDRIMLARLERTGGLGLKGLTKAANTGQTPGTTGAMNAKTKIESLVKKLSPEEAAKAISISDITQYKDITPAGAGEKVYDRSQKEANFEAIKEFIEGLREDDLQNAQNFAKMSTDVKDEMLAALKNKYQTDFNNMSSKQRIMYQTLSAGKASGGGGNTSSGGGRNRSNRSTQSSQHQKSSNQSSTGSAYKAYYRAYNKEQSEKPTKAPDRPTEPADDYPPSWYEFDTRKK